MPWRLLGFIVVLVGVVIFIGGNTGNACDVNLIFVKYENVPIYVSLLAAFIVGVVIMIPFTFGKRRGRRAKEDSRPAREDRPARDRDESPARDDRTQYRDNSLAERGESAVYRGAAFEADSTAVSPAKETRKERKERERLEAQEAKQRALEEKQREKEEKLRAKEELRRAKKEKRKKRGKASGDAAEVVAQDAGVPAAIESASALESTPPVLAESADDATLVGDATL